MSTESSRVVLIVTTVCDLSCPRCCYGIPEGRLGAPRHLSWEDFERAAEHLCGLDVLFVSGGEPTLHPDFARIAREFRGLFQPRNLALATNGAHVTEYAEEMRAFDDIRLTMFPREVTRRAWEYLRAREPMRLRPQTPEHVDVGVPGGGGACGRERIPAVVGERVYPCCVAPGLIGSHTVALMTGWQRALAEIEPPCTDCGFSLP